MTRGARLVVAVWTAMVLSAAVAHARQGPITLKDIATDPTARTVDVLFGVGISGPLLAEIERPPAERGWLIVSVETKTGLNRTLPVSSVTVQRPATVPGAPPPLPAQVTLQLDRRIDAAWLDTETHVISVMFLRGAGLPRFTWPPPGGQADAASQRRFVAAPAVATADVYFSGKVTAVSDAKPLYSFEAKLQDAWFVGSGTDTLGYAVEAAADDEVDADPDRITVASTYRRILDRRPASTILRVQPIGGEFARRQPRTRGVLSTATLEHVLVPTTGPASARVAVVVFGGAEIGSNLANAIDRDGSGAVARFRFATNPYVVFTRPSGPFKVIKASALWQARVLARDEIDPDRLDDAGQPTLTGRMRQHLAADVDIGLNDFVSLTFQHRWGQVPPTYNVVKPTFALSLTFKGSWNRSRG